MYWTQDISKDKSPPNVLIKWITSKTYKTRDRGGLNLRGEGSISVRGIYKLGVNINIWQDRSSEKRGLVFSIIDLVQTG